MGINFIGTGRGAGYGSGNGYGLGDGNGIGNRKAGVSYARPS